MDNPSSTSPTVTYLKQTASVSLAFPPILIKAGTPFFSSLGRPIHSSRPPSSYHMAPSSSNFGLASVKIGHSSTMPLPTAGPPTPSRHVRCPPSVSVILPSPPQVLVGLPTYLPVTVPAVSSPGRPHSLPRLGTRGRPLKHGHPPFRLKSWSASLPPLPRCAPLLDFKYRLVALPRLGTRYRPLKTQDRPPSSPPQVPVDFPSSPWTQ
ncbi:hypothetical protein CF327_g5975 [Tilletia walkeri]|nr:hypothetical protein CF327_g5975 [Tilletia walkeri]